MFEAVPRFLIPIPDSVMLVEAVRDSGSPVFALSNLHRSSLSHIDATYSVFELFDGRVVSCEVGACRPEAEIYSRLLEREGLNPLETVFIDDVQANLDAAVEFGFHTIRFEDAGTCRAELHRPGCVR